MKTHLIGSCGSLQQMAELIAKHFYWNEPAVLLDNKDNTWNIIFPAGSPKAGTLFKHLIVCKKKNRYRLERL